MFYANINRHESEGFNLCDEVHCQAFKGITSFTNSIYQSTALTANKVIVNANNNFITAAFHANCGGETESSLNTWLKAEDYLVPVKDIYCTNNQGSHWEKKIPLSEWKKNLNSHGIKTQSLPLASLAMKKPGRQMYYRIGKDSILTKQIRNDWNFKSSFFQVSVKNNIVLIKGFGYGHGVGLCQEGAMNMAILGKTCEEIINFYFKGVHLQTIE
jgi:stage II sporulation protein D